MEISEDQNTLRTYIQQYQGNSRFLRLLTLADRQT